MVSGDTMAESARRTRGTMRFAKPVAVAACLALVACASARTPDARLPAAFEAPTGGGLPAEALDTWWTAFNDPELNTLIDQALAASPDARSATARLREARAIRRSGLAQLWPQGQATGSARKTHTEQLSGAPVTIPGFSSTGDTRNYQAAFDVSWEVDLFGRTLAARKVLNGDLAAARFAYEGARTSLAANVADSYFEARGLAIQLEDARETVRIRRGLLDIAAKRAERGLGASADADQVAGDLAQAESQAAGLEADLQAARRVLLILVGRGAEPTANLPVTTVVGVIPPMPATIPSQLLARRPDVREAEARISSASGRLKVAQRAFLPTFTLRPGLGWARTEEPNYTSVTQNWSLGLGVVQPILDIPKLMADLKAEDARTEQAVIAYEKTVQTAFGEAENALVGLDADQRRVGLLTDGEVRAQRGYKAARIRYDMGLDDLQAALNAEQSWRAVRSQLTAAQVQALRRAVQSYKALGGGWPAERLPTNAQAR